MDSTDYKAAYERQKLARERAENMLEQRSRSLYETNESLKRAYEKLKNQKSQLIHQEKLASIGQLAAGVAHEINNPVGFIRSNLMTLGRYVEQAAEVVSVYQSALSDIFEAEEVRFARQLDSVAAIEERFDIDYILDDLPKVVADSVSGTDRVAEIVQGLKSFARADADQMELLDVVACLENTLKLVQNEIKYKAEVKLALKQVPLTMGYPGNFSQVILNLLVNAAQAIKEFGEIELSVCQEGGEILIQVSDNGCGMSADAIDRIFDPFFTTKPVGEGTGLGLAISLGIIKKHNGSISVESEPNQGTTFSIRLPIVEGAA